MSNIAWNIVHSNFHEFMEDSATGVNSLTSINNAYSESTDVVELRTLPSSIWNGKYSVQLESIDLVNTDLNTIMNFQYLVKLQVAYEFALRSGQNEYNKAVSDIEEIIRRRLNVSTYPENEIIQVEFVSAGPLEFPDNEELERFSLVNLIFRVTGRVNLT